MGVVCRVLLVPWTNGEVSNWWIFVMGIRLRLDVPTAVIIHIVIFWGVTPCSRVGGFRCFGRTYFHRLQGVKCLQLQIQP
jgi:hypothetical protein